MDQPAMRFQSALAHIVLTAALASGLAVAAHAQTRVVRTPSAVLSSPRGTTIGSVRPGVELRVIESRGSYSRVSVAGYVERARLTRWRGSSSTRVGSRSAVVRTRGASSARAIASLDAGTIVSPGSGTAPKGWVKVSRTGWLLSSALGPPPGPAAVTGRTTAPAPRAVAAPSAGKATARARVAAPIRDAREVEPGRRSSAGEVESAPSPTRAQGVAAAVAASAAPDEGAHSGGTSMAPMPDSSLLPAPAAAPTDSALVPTSNVALRAAPDARAVATIAQGTTLEPLARERGWVRVRVEGWVPERDLAPADTSVRSNVSAADLRADPKGSKGRMVRWKVQILARQMSDPLRRDLSPDEVYFLARGPSDENALLYLVIPPSLIESSKSVTTLSDVVVTARVRTGKSELVGVPILDLVTIAAVK